MEIPKRAPQRLTTHEVWRHSHPGLCLAAGAGWKAHICSDKGSTKLPFWDLPLGNRTHDPPQFFPSKITPNCYLYQENHFCYAVLPIPSIWGNTPPPPNHYCNSFLLPRICNASLLFLTAGVLIPSCKAWGCPQPVPLCTHGSFTPLSKAASKGTSSNSTSPLLPRSLIIRS